MNSSFFDSSDAARGSGLPDQVNRIVFDEPFELDCGAALSNAAIAYETYGQLNDRRDNAVLICHALSGDSHVGSHSPDDQPGWWDMVVGSGRAIDTDKYFVICSNALGGCRGTTGPADINEQTQKPWGFDFPQITISDIVRLQKRLVDSLGIKRLRSVIGGSMGGQQAMLWPMLYPDSVSGVAVIASTARLTSQALAFDIVGRNAIINDPNFNGGQYYNAADKPDIGLAIARMIGHVTYLSREAMVRKFDGDRRRARKISEAFEQDFSVGSYLGYQGQKFVDRFDANSYLVLSKAMDLFDPAEKFGSLTEAFERTSCQWMVASFTSDWLFPPAESRRIVDTLIQLDRRVSYCNIASDSGHDAFLLADEILAYTPMLRGFLENLDTECCCGGDGDRPAVDAAPAIDDAHVFHPQNPQRLDYQHILQLVAPGESVLDLGCGSGALLRRLCCRDRSSRIMGLELDQSAVIDCASQGLDVLHCDLNEGLSAFADKSFDVVVLSHTLQSIRNVSELLGEMRRVGGRCIVSFPNFGYHKLRRMLTEQGRAPVSPGLLSYNWFDTPNRRFFTIADFEDYCAQHNIAVESTVFLDTERSAVIAADQQPNMAADMAIFVVS